MAVQKISIDEFIQLASSGIIIDVRSPGEFEHAHLSGKLNLILILKSFSLL